MKRYLLHITVLLFVIILQGCSSAPVSNNDNTVSVSYPPSENKEDADTQSEADVPSSDGTVSETPKPAKPTKTPAPTMDPDTWDYVSISGGNMIYTEPEDTPKVMPYEIHVNKQMNCITVYKRNKKGEYKKPVYSFVCSAGSATPLGTFKTSTKYHWKAMIHKVWAQYATRITGDILFHSVPYDTYKKDTLITSYYNQLGRTASAGCVRLCVRDAKWIMENCPSGTTVVIYNSPDPGPLGKPAPVSLVSGFRWDPTDPDKRNPLKRKKSGLIGVADRTVERGSSFNIYENIVAFDKKLYALPSSEIKVKGKVDPDKTGTYSLTYSFTDSSGKKFKETATITVADTQKPVIIGLPEKYYVKNIDNVTAQYLADKVTVTDNGDKLDKNKYLKVSYSDGKAVLTAKDDYNHTTVLNVRVYEDNEAPVLELRSNLETTLPVSVSFTESYARKRIKTAEDDKASIGKNDVKVSIKKQGGVLKVTYTLTDLAGNATSLSEKIKYEEVYIEVLNPAPQINDITKEKALCSFITVRSKETGKKVKYSVKTSREKLERTETHTIYKVTYKAKVTTTAGTTTLTQKLNVSVPN